MCPNLSLQWWADISAIAGFAVTLVGACIGGYEYLRFRCHWKAKTDQLIQYLKSEKETAAKGKKGQHTAMHLVRHVGLTEQEILKISFENIHVRRTVGEDEHGNAAVLYFEYAP